MHNSMVAPVPRRSSRVPVTMPILVTSLEPTAHFSEVCETLVVSAHGCAMRSPIKLEAGVPLHLHSKDGRETEARVVYCQPLGSDQQGWRLGAKLERPENFWGLAACPQDWPRWMAPAAVEGKRPPVPAHATQSGQAQVGPSLKVILDKMQKQVSDEHLRAMMAEMVQPLHSEIVELKEKLGRGEQKRSRFEVSLSQIPPELEQQLEQRLHKDLGPRVLSETRQQSEQVLEAAKAAIARKTAETHSEFLEQVKHELQKVEQRAQSLSAHLDEGLRQQWRSGLGELQQHMVDAGNRLKRLSEELLQVLQHNLGEEHEARRRELQQVQEAVAAESSRLQEKIAVLGGRVERLSEAAQRLESGLDQRLAQLASDMVSSTRSQMESAVDELLEELRKRNAQELEKQVQDACANLKIIQKGIEGSVSESLKAQAAESLQSFEHSMEELGRQSAGKWRTALAGRLDLLLRTLGEQLKSESA